VKLWDTLLKEMLFVFGCFGKSQSTVEVTGPREGGDVRGSPYSNNDT
jgi:hypothetical protein